MTNWNPSYDTRFKPGHQPEGRGSRKGIKDRINKKFLQDFAEEWAMHGAAAIARVREEDPLSFVRIALTLTLAFEKEVPVERPLDSISDEDLEQLLAIATKVKEAGSKISQESSESCDESRMLPGE
jgi:hypothetical protein